MIVASVDIGTNTVILLIAEMKNGKIIPLYNEQQIPRIGKGLNPGKMITSDKKQLLMEILSAYKKKIEQYHPEEAVVVATNAFRIAGNGIQICREIKEKLDMDVKIVAGGEEARLSYLGAVSGLNNDKKTLVIDIGGGSTELISGKGREIEFKKSFNAGVVSGTEKFLAHDPPSAEEISNLRNYIIQTFSEVINEKIEPETAITIAGTPTTLACIMKDLPEFNEDAIEGTFLNLEELNELIAKLAVLSITDILSKYKSVAKGREDVLLAGTLILYEVMNLLNLDKVMVSTRGIRYGALLEYASKD